ncbi:MAG TPA: signal peptide peptidase SppA [Dissulfurispiraceae bacterium]|nr:signal peptide peptidase SppA [Dissulfurispiraceae bacterium]
MKKYWSLLIPFMITLSGCGGLNIALLPETKPLEEQVLEGSGSPKILLIDLDGMISFREEKDGLFLKRPSKVAFFREAFRKASDDPDITGVIIRINSPGGTVAASDALYHEIVSFKQNKRVPVYAYILEVGASGAFYVAASADRIIASRSSIVGSIGVVAMKINVEGLLSKIGVTEETYKSAPKKDFWSPFRASTPEEQKMLQDIIDKLYAQFVDVVYSNRHGRLSMEQVKALADGRIVVAQDALNANLIDQVAYLDETVDIMKKSLNIEQARLCTYIRPKTFKSNIYSAYQAEPSSATVNLISINADDFMLHSGLQFMYLWTP